MFEGKAEFGITFNKEKWLQVEVSSTITDWVGLWTLILSLGILKGVLEIVSLILSVVTIMIYYVAVATKYRGMVAFTLGFKYFFRILLLTLSFITLELLIGITVGI